MLETAPPSRGQMGRGYSEGRKRGVWDGRAEGLSREEKLRVVKERGRCGGGRKELRCANSATGGKVGTTGSVVRW